MGAHRWILRQIIRSDTEVAVGTMTRFKTFAPYHGMRLRNYGIHRDQKNEEAGDIIEEVSSVDNNTEDFPDYFLVELEVETAENSCQDSIALYGPKWDWKLYARGEEPLIP